MLPIGQGIGTEIESRTRFPIQEPLGTMNLAFPPPGPQEPVQHASHGPTNPFIPFQKQEIEQSIPGRFEQQVSQHPNRLAVKGRRSALTYEDLNRYANRIGRAILAARGDSEETVGLLLQKDVPFFAALLGALKAGKIYVPLDPAHPAARTIKMLEDADARLILTDDMNYAMGAELAHGSRALINIDRMDSHLTEENLGLALQPNALAYIIYTSGSTGEPKGVVQTHRNVLHNIMVYTNNLHISADDRLSLLASVSTAQAVLDIYSALLNGATLCPFNVKEDGLSSLGRWLDQEEISIYHSSASIFRSLLDTLGDQDQFHHVRLIKLGSEQVFKSDVERYKKCFSHNCIFVNSLSSTETGTVRQIYIDKDTLIDGDIVPVGFPVEDAEILLLDEDGRPVDAGTPGEIVVKSRYLAPGYWRRPELTQAAFRTAPEHGDSRLYHTGDLGRISPTGCLEYCGRKDQRVKIRGFRVEVAEIEAVLYNHCHVRHAAVVARQGKHGGPRLEAYIVPTEMPTPTAHSLRTMLKRNLPDHMVPSWFFILEELPLTPSGKVDRNSLRSAPSFQSRAEVAYKPPQSPLEWQIVKIWEGLLETRPIGVQEDFFELGGDSLLALEMISLVEKECGIRLPVSAMFGRATVEYLAGFMLDTNRGRFRSPFLKIQDGTSGRPFFFFHGDYNGGGFYCRNLAQRLGREFTFISVHPHGLDGEPIPQTIEEMAADRLRVLLDFHPSGPYLLGGHCNGGLVAFEMARQMRAMGLDVDSLVLVDASAVNTRHRGLRSLIRCVGFPLRWDHREQVDCFIRTKQFLVRWHQLSQEGSRAQIFFLLKKIEKVVQMMIKFTKPQTKGQASPSEILNRHAKDCAYRLAVRGYIPGPYDGRVTFLCTDAMQSRLPDDPTVGWGRVASQLEVIPIPGDHLNCLTTHVSSLAQHLVGCLGAPNPCEGRTASYGQEKVSKPTPSKGPFASPEASTITE
jgi:amino acid adenylation domain-containing protein